MPKKKIIEFEVTFEEGFWQAAGVHEDIFTLAETLDQLWANLREAIALHLDLPQHQLPPISLKIIAHATTATAGR